MTPKEKAEDIMDSFVRDGYDIVLDEKQAKRCALIAVDEIINSVVIMDLTVAENQFNYWEQVKHEIEQL